MLIRMRQDFAVLGGFNHGESQEHGRRRRAKS